MRQVLKAIARKLSTLGQFLQYSESYSYYSSDYILISEGILKRIIYEIYKRKRIKQSELIKIVSLKERCGRDTVLKAIKKLKYLGIIVEEKGFRPLTSKVSPILMLNEEKVQIVTNYSFFNPYYFIIIFSLILSTALSFFYGFAVMLGSALTNLLLTSKVVYDLYKSYDLKMVIIKASKKTNL